MRTKTFLLATALAVMLGGVSALAQETTETAEASPEANTVFVATIDTSVAETTYIKYHVCGLNSEAAADCQGVLDNFDDESFDWTTFAGFTEIEVSANGEGELNHGSFVSAFAQGFEGPGKGCLVRFIAQSDWGKEGSDIDGDDVLIQATTHCSFNADKPGNSQASDEDDAERNGPPAWAGAGKRGASGEDSTAGGKPDWAGKPGGPKNADD